MGLAEALGPERSQQAIDRGGADPQQGLAHRGREADLAVALQDRQQLGEEGGEAFRAELAGGLPDVQERAGDRGRVARRASPASGRWGGLAVQQADSRFAMVAGDPAELSQDAGFLPFTGGAVGGADGLGVFPDASGAHGASRFR